MDLRADQILSKLLSDKNWLMQIEHSLNRSIEFWLKYSSDFVLGFVVINSKISMNWKNPTKVNIGAFKSSVGLHHNDFFNKLFFGKKGTNDVR